MIRRVATVVTVAVATLVAAAVGTGTAHATGLAFAPCHGSSGVLCSSLPVPLDWSHAAAGTLSLSVEELPAKGTPRGVMILIAGGPGQASALAFDLADLGSRWRAIFPGYTLVAFDPRGTGNSGFLGCSLDDAVSIAAQVADCGNAIGPSRVYYTTAANADDVDSVRQALGMDKVALWGTSYGTKVALAYAGAHADHVERLLLDSVVPTSGPDPLGLDSLQGIPRGMAALCGNVTCRAIVPNLAAAIVTLANRAAVTPIRGRVRTASGRLIGIALDGPTLLELVVASDLNPGVRAELPSAAAAAVAGRPQALLRLAAFSSGRLALTAEDASFSDGLFLATECNDGRFPWQPDDASIPDRQQVLASAVAALPAGSTGPFGSWATAIGPASYCVNWPSPAGNAPLLEGALPDVPVLALSGGLDMRTPTANATGVVTQFPQGHVVVVPGIGHSVLTTDPSGCAVRAVRTWLDGGAVPTRCAATRPFLADVGKLPVSVAAARPSHGVPGLRGKTLSIAGSTVEDAAVAWLTAGTSVGGLVGGKVSGTPAELTLSGYSDVPGLAVSGTIRLTSAKTGALIAPTGSVTVSGPKAARGVITITAGVLTARWSS